MGRDKKNDRNGRSKRRGRQPAGCSIMKITAIKAMQVHTQGTLIKIETDAGVVGYGECHATAFRMPTESASSFDPMRKRGWYEK